MFWNNLSLAISFVGFIMLMNEFHAYFKRKDHKEFDEDLAELQRLEFMIWQLRKASMPYRDLQYYEHFFLLRMNGFHRRWKGRYVPGCLTPVSIQRLANQYDFTYLLDEEEHAKALEMLVK